MGLISEDIEPVFDFPSFYSMYLTLNQRYREMQFTDDISDSERIAEFKWITQQLRKYITKQKSIVLKHRDKDSMLAEIDSLISKTEDDGDTRKEIVYNIMRDEFMLALYNTVKTYNEEDETEDDDEWI